MKLNTTAEERVLKFKKGDKVVVLRMPKSTGKPIGSVGVIDNINTHSLLPYRIVFNDEDYWYYGDEHLAAAVAVTDPKTSSVQRKSKPLFSGVLMYFPDALMAVAEHSRKANDKHNPGEPLHWSKGKSTDHADCIARHLLDIGPTWNLVDPEFGSLHATALAWRALALLQTVLERNKK